MTRRKEVKPSFEAIGQKLREMRFELTPANGGGQFVRKYGCAAGIEPSANGSVRFFARPGRVVQGELARLIDRGYQKFLKTADTEVPALAEDLSALRRFIEELRYAIGSPTLYNEALGSVSDRYLYDRVWFRDEGAQPKPWEKAGSTPSK